MKLGRYFWMSWVLWVAGLVNIFAVLIGSRAFTNDSLTTLYPQIFSRSDMVGIILWGLAYIVCARNIAAIPRLLLVFALEKFFYFGSWVAWICFGGHHIMSLLHSGQIPAMLLAVYGPNDLFFGLLFVLMYILLRRWPISRPVTAQAQSAAD